MRFIHWWPLVAALCIMLLLELAVFRVAPLVELAPGQAQSSRRRLVWFSVLVVVLVGALVILRGLPTQVL
jgi:hypothetical protein